MPLIKSRSKKAFSENVSTEMHHGKPQDQALAIAYSVKRKAGKKKMAKGGEAKSDQRYFLDRAQEMTRPVDKQNYKDIARSRAVQRIAGERMIPPPKLKGMAEGGMAYKNDSAITEQRPMPSELDNDRQMESRNRGNKAPSEDSWTDRPTERQAAKGMKTTIIKHPKMVPQSLYTARLRDEEDDLEMTAKPGPYGEQPPSRDNEEGPNRQGHPIRDMEDEHSTHRKPYASGGQIEPGDEDSHNINMRTEMEPMDDSMEMRERREQNDHMMEDSPSEDRGTSHAMGMNEEGPDRQGDEVPDMEKPHNGHQRSVYAQGGEVGETSMDQPNEEEEIMHAASIAAAIMSKRRMDSRRIHSGSQDEDSAAGMYAEGGETLLPEDKHEIHSHGSMDTHESADQADLSRNADEDANEEDEASRLALLKENYSETPGLDELDSPMDSGMTDDPRETDEENVHDRSLVSKIRSAMKKRSPITR